MPINVPFGDAPQEGAEEMNQGADQAIQAGLQQILQTQDINEAHQIAQSLLGEAQVDQNTEAAAPDMDAQLMAAMSK